jgi:site-specific recombinase XerD
MAPKGEIRERAPAWNGRYLFSSRRGSIDPQTRSVGRQHGSDTWIGKHFKRAMKGSGRVKRVTFYTLRQSFVMHFLADRADMRTVLNLVPHKYLRSEMTHKHVVQYSARVRGLIQQLYSAIQAKLDMRKYPRA